MSQETEAPGPPTTTRVRPAVLAGFSCLDLALVALVFIWGVNFSVVKAALAQLSPLSFNSLRFVLASVSMLLLSRTIDGAWHVLPGDGWRLVALGLLGHTCYQLAFINGLARTKAGNSSLILGMTPIFVALLGAGLHIEHVRGRTWVGILLSFAGVAFIVQGGAHGVGLGSETWAGDLLTLAATSCWAAYTVFSRPLLGRYTPLTLTALTMAIGTLPLIPLALPELSHQDWTAVSSQGWLGLLFSFSLAIVAAYTIWYSGVQRIGSTRTAVYSNLVPVVGVLTAWTWLGETMVPLQALGALIILVGIALTRWGQGAASTDYTSKREGGT